MKNRFIKNLSWIFVGNIVHAILQFSLNIYVARILSTSDYGLINYVASLIAFFISVGTLGFNGVITQKFAEYEENAGEYLGSAILARILFSLFSVISLQIIVHISEPDNKLLHIIVLCQSLTVVFSSFDLIMYWFRYKSQANVIAILRLAAFMFSAIWRVAALTVQKSVTFYVLGTSSEIVLFSVFMLWAYIKYSPYKFTYSVKTIKKLFVVSYPFISSAILVTIYGQTDKIMLKSMLDSSSVAYYSVSLTLAGAISIIPAALIEGFRPDIMSFKIKDEQMYQKRLRQLYGIVFWLCTAYCLFITIFAKPIILLLYGEKYLPAVPALAIIVWYTSFSYFGAINNMYLVAEKKTKWVQVITLFGAVINIILNAVLIPILGILGASVASLITQVVSNFGIQSLIPQLRGNFKLIIEGILLKNCFKALGYKRKRV